MSIDTKNNELSILSGGGSLGGSEKGDIFEKYGEEASPFDLVTEEAVEEDIMANGETGGNGGSGGMSDDDDDSDEDLPEELKRDYVDEQPGETPPPASRSTPKHLRHSKVSARRDFTSILQLNFQKYFIFCYEQWLEWVNLYYLILVPTQASIVTNTTLTILRLIGKYIQMMRLLQPIAFDVMVCLSHLFDYYLYSVFTFFGDRWGLEGGECWRYLMIQNRKCALLSQIIHKNDNR